MLVHMLLNPISHSHFSSLLILQKHLTKLIILFYLKHFVWPLANKFAPHRFLLIDFPVSLYFLNLSNLECPGLTPWMSLLPHYIHSFKTASLVLDFNITYTPMASSCLCVIKSFPSNSRCPGTMPREDSA